MKIHWPKQIIQWQGSDRTGFLSVPFTWLLPEAKRIVTQGNLFVDRWVVGGPAVRLMPDYLAGLPNVVVGDEMPGVLQRVNPLATRTTVGCVRQCAFYGVRRIEGRFHELPDWPDLPVICDSNLLAASHRHFHRVTGRLIQHGWCDFNQGLDARFLTNYHAIRIAKIPKPIVRLALDSDADREPWAAAVDLLRSAGIAKARIRSYVLCGFRGGPKGDRARCEFVESFGLKALPMWLHELDALEFNAVTRQQHALGWTKRKQRELFCWYYQHRTLAGRG